LSHTQGVHLDIVVKLIPGNRDAALIIRELMSPAVEGIATLDVDNEGRTARLDQLVQGRTAAERLRIQVNVFLVGSHLDRGLVCGVLDIVRIAHNRVRV